MRMGHGRSEPDHAKSQMRRLCLWSSFFLVALLAHDLSREVAYTVVGAGMATALLFLGPGLVPRLATAIAMVPAAVAPAWEPGIGIGTVVVAGVLVALAGPVGLSQPSAASLNPLQQHIARARRRAERVHVLSLTVADAAEIAGADLRNVFRLTDTVAVRSIGDRYAATAVLDDHELFRGGLERRLSELVPATTTVGWAAFPDDGFSLEALIEQAEADARPLSAMPVAAPVPLEAAPALIADVVVEPAPAVVALTGDSAA